MARIIAFLFAIGSLVVIKPTTPRTPGTRPVQQQPISMISRLKLLARNASNPDGGADEDPDGPGSNSSPRDKGHLQREGKGIGRTSTVAQAAKRNLDTQAYFRNVSKTASSGRGMT